MRESLKSYHALKKLRGEVIITVGGHLKAAEVRDMVQFLSSNRFYKSQPVCLDLKHLKSIDTSGSWVLLNFAQSLRRQQIPVRFEHMEVGVSKVLDQVERFIQPQKHQALTPANLLISFLERLGRTAYQSYRSSYSVIGFLGQIFLAFLITLIKPKRFRWNALFSMIQRVGFDALPIVGLISFLIGVVLIYQSVDQLKRFGAEIFAVDLLTISVMREIGILLTAIVVAGRSGSAFTAQLGFMNLNQEMDAMVVMAMSPIEVLVLPRILALMIALPILAFFSDIMALMGGAFMSVFLLDLSLDQFFQQVRLAVSPWTFWIGVMKAPFFAAMIGMIACFEGMRVQGGSVSVGIHTTKSVVEGIFIVIVLDAAFSIIFSYIGI